MDPIALAVVAWILLSGEKGAPTTRETRRKIEKLERQLPTTKRRRRRKPPPPPPPRDRGAARRRRLRKSRKAMIREITETVTVPGKKTTTVTTTTRRRKSPLTRRANQRRARDWRPDLRKAGASPRLARALARWIGIESSGNPLAKSRIGERGLLQATKTTALKEKLFTPAEWEKLRSPASSRAFHAKMALKQYKYHRRRARRWVSNKPPISSLDWVYYAKLHHTRPRDLREGKVHGPALPMARDLWTRGRGKPRRRQRLALANVSRFGKVYV